MAVIKRELVGGADPCVGDSRRGDDFLWSAQLPDTTTPPKMTRKNKKFSIRFMSWSLTAKELSDMKLCYPHPRVPAPPAGAVDRDLIQQNLGHDTIVESRTHDHFPADHMYDSQGERATMQLNPPATAAASATPSVPASAPRLSKEFHSERLIRPAHATVRKTVTASVSRISHPSTEPPKFRIAGTESKNVRLPKPAASAHPTNA